MSTPPFATSDAEVAKLFSYNLEGYYDTISDQQLIGRLINRGVLDNRTDLQKSSGDTINHYFAQRIQSRGFVDDEAITGSENIPSMKNASIALYELNQVTKVPNNGTISAQRTGFDMQEIATKNNRMWLQERMTVGVLNQLCGNSATSITWDGITHSTTTRLKEVNAGSTPVAPSSGRISRPNSLSTDQAVNSDTTATLKFSQILNLERIAQTTRVYVPPLSSNGVKYLFLTHPDTFYQLMTDVTDPHQGREMILAQMANGGKKDFTIGDTFRYFNTEIMVTDKCPRGVHSGTGAEQTNTRRSVLLGMNAGSICFGKGYSAGGETVPGFGTWSDDQDVKRWVRLRNGVVWAAKKTVFDSVDYSTIVLTNYVAQ